MTYSLARSLALLILVAAMISARAEAIEGGSRLVNLSSRGDVGTGADVLIAGFVIGGPSPKDVLIRAVGPTLATQGVSGVLDRPRLQIFNVKGELIASNDQWNANLKGAFSQVGAFALPDASADAALRLSLPPGNYSAHVSGENNPRGIALVEVYEMDGASQLLNLSTRGRVEAGDGLLISGLVISGKASRRVLIRAAGPALVPLGVTGVLGDPTLTVLNSSGVAVASNDNWGDGGHAAEIDAAGASVGAFQFAAASSDAALVADLPPGRYTIHVRGHDDGNRPAGGL